MKQSTMTLIWVVVATLGIIGALGIITAEKPEPSVPQMDKATYLETVRENNPEYPDLMECIYSQYIDKHGIEETLKMDLKYYGSNDMSESLKTEIAEMGANC